MKRKIAIISDHVSPLVGLRSVVENEKHNIYVAQLARSLASLGNHVDVFTCKDQMDLPEVYEWLDHVRVIHVPLGQIKYGNDENLADDRTHLSDYMIEFFNKQEKPYDLVHAYLWDSGLIAAEIKEALGTPFVFTFGGLGHQQHLPQKNGQVSDGRLQMEDRVIQNADGIIAGSPQDRDDLITRYDANPMYIVQIPDGSYLEQHWATDGAEAQKQFGVLNDERPITLSPTTWQNFASVLAEFYEDVLAVRRVAIIQMETAPQPVSQETHLNGRSLMEETFMTTLQTFQETRETLSERILDAARLVTECLHQGGRIMVCGDGRSAALAQHFADELTGDFIIPGGAGLPVLSLTTQPAFWSDWSSNVGYEQVFARQVEMLGRPGDLLVGISAGGDPVSLAEAFQLARAHGIRCLALLGKNSGDLPALSDVVLVIPNASARRVQEVQLLVLHLLCELVAEHMPGGLQIMAGSIYDAAHAISVPRR